MEPSVTSNDVKVDDNKTEECGEMASLSNTNTNPAPTSINDDSEHTNTHVNNGITGTPNPTDGTSVPVRTYDEFLIYLSRKHPSIRSTKLRFEGRNTVLYRIVE